jgi:hypothetical protein
MSSGRPWPVRLVLVADLVQHPGHLVVEQAQVDHAVPAGHVPQVAQLEAVDLFGLVVLDADEDVAVRDSPVLPTKSSLSSPCRSKKFGIR